MRRQLPYEDFWQLFGEGKHPDAERLYEHKLAPFLTQTSHKFWKERLWYFKQGLYYQGGQVSTFCPVHVPPLGKDTSRARALYVALAALHCARTEPNIALIWLPALAFPGLNVSLRFWGPVRDEGLSLQVLPVGGGGRAGCE